MTSSDRTLYAMALGAAIMVAGFVMARTDDALRVRLQLFSAAPAAAGAPVAAVVQPACPHPTKRR